MQSAQGGRNSVTSPAGVMRAIAGGAFVNSVPRVNQRLPSAPLVIARGCEFAVGTLYCFSAPTGAASAMGAPPANASAVASRTRRRTGM